MLSFGEAFQAFRSFGFRRWHQALMVGLAALVFAFLLLVPFSLGSLCDTVLLGAVISVAALGFLCWCERILDRRINAEVSQWKWVVRVNDVPVGELSDQAYASVQRDLLFDCAVYEAQIGNFFHCASRIIGRALFIFPVAAFWIGLLFAMAAPDQLFEIAHGLMGMGGAGVTASAHLIVQAFVYVVILAVAMDVMMGWRFGFKNVFRAAFHEKLRLAVRSPASGNVHYYRIPVKPAS